MMKLTGGFLDYTNAPKSVSAKTLHDFSADYKVRYNYQFSFAVERGSLHYLVYTDVPTALFTVH
jgi:hypothetical protein